MVVILFVVSFLLALGVSLAMSRISRGVAEPILRRFFAPSPRLLMANYLQLVVVVVGVSNGTPIRLVEDYLGAPSWNRPDLARQLTPEVWAVAPYHTFVDSLVGIVWLLLIAGFLLAMTLLGLRRSPVNLRWLLSERERVRAANARAPVVPIR